MSKDVIKDLVRGQKSQSRQEPGQKSTASAAIPAGPMTAQVNKPVVIPSGPWTGPIGFSAAAPAEHPSSRPGDFSTFFSRLPTSGTGLGTETPALLPQSFMPQAAGAAYPAYQISAATNQTGLPAGAAPDFVGYPTAQPAGDLDLSNVDPTLVPLNPVDSFEVSALENEFMGEFFDIDIDLDLNAFNL